MRTTLLVVKISCILRQCSTFVTVLSACSLRSDLGLMFSGFAGVVNLRSWMLILAPTIWLLDLGEFWSPIRCPSAGQALQYCLYGIPPEDDRKWLRAAVVDGRKSLRIPLGASRSHPPYFSDIEGLNSFNLPSSPNIPRDHHLKIFLRLGRPNILIFSLLAISASQASCSAISDTSV